MILLKNNYEEDEKLFSTGDDELDEILEEVYYSGLEDGYDYAQREFSKRKPLHRSRPFESKILRQVSEAEGRGRIVDDMKRKLEEISKKSGPLSNEYEAQLERLNEAQHQLSVSKRRLKALKGMRKAAPWVLAGTAVAGGTAAGIALSKKAKKKKEENK